MQISWDPFHHFIIDLINNFVGHKKIFLGSTQHHQCDLQNDQTPSLSLHLWMVATYSKGPQLSCIHQLLYWQVAFCLQHQVEISHDFSGFHAEPCYPPVHLFLHLHGSLNQSVTTFSSHKATVFFIVQLTILVLFAFSISGNNCQKLLLTSITLLPNFLSLSCDGTNLLMDWSNASRHSLFSIGPSSMIPSEISERNYPVSDSFLKLQINSL